MSSNSRSDTPIKKKHLLPWKKPVLYCLNIETESSKIIDSTEVVLGSPLCKIHSTTSNTTTVSAGLCMAYGISMFSETAHVAGSSVLHVAVSSGPS